MSDSKTQGKKGILKNVSIKIKLSFAFISFALLVFIVGGGLVFKQNKLKTIKYSFQKLEIVNNLKKSEIEKYFSRLKEQTIILSDYDLFVDAAKDLKQAFRLFDSDASVVSPSELENHTLDLKAFYNSEYIPLLYKRTANEYSLEDLIPDDNRTLLLQYLFLASNPNDFENKKLFDKPLNSGDYGLSHFKYQPQIRELALRYGIDDVYLIDSESGHVFYSLNKNPDFATSLLSGPYRNSALAKNFKKTNTSNLKNHIEINDLEFYTPSGSDASMFISSPVFADGKKIAVLVFELNADKIDEVIANGIDWDEIELGETGDINIVGGDNKLRNNTRANISYPDKFLKDLNKEQVDNNIIDKIKTYKSTALLLEKNYYNTSYKPGIDEKSGIKKYAKEEIFSVIQKLKIDGVNWSVVTRMDKTEALEEQGKTLLVFLLVIVGILFIASSIGRYYTGSLVDRLNTIKNSIVTLSNGEKVNTLEDNSADEISETFTALNQLNGRIDGASDFALSIGQGNFQMTFDPISERDKLGVSLNEMKTSLEKAKKDEQERVIEEQKRNWTTEGIAVFSDLLRRNNDNIEKLSQNLVGKLVEYLDASLAGVFLLNEDINPPTLGLASSYAFDRHKFLKKEIPVGEGLVGTCAQEQKTIFLKEIPEDYIQITSGFGETKPKSILLVPMIVEDNLMGVIEIASMKLFEDYQIDFVEKIGENIGSTLISVRVNAQTAKLLEESKVKSEEMAAQEEEMRQNLEELQATQEDLRKQAEISNRASEELAKEKSLIDTMLKYIPENIYFKDKDSKFIKASQSMAANFKVENVEEIYGKSDFDFYAEEHARPAYEDEQRIIRTGEPMLDKIEKETHADGTVRYVTTSKMPLYDTNGKIIGTFGITKDTTEIYAKQDEIEQRNKELVEREEEMRQSMEELKTTQDDLKEQAEISAKAQEELIKETMIIDTMLKNIPEYIYFKDRDSKFIKASQSMAASFKVKDVEEIYGKSDFDFYAEEHARPAFQDEQEIIRTAKPMLDKIEKETHKDGSVRYVSTSKMPLYDHEGNIIGTFGITKDITESYESQAEIKQRNEELLAQEEELRQNLEELQATQDELAKQAKISNNVREEMEKERALLFALLDNMPESIYFKDKDSKFIRISKNMLELFDAQNFDEVIGKSDFDFFGKEHAQQAFDDEQKIIKTGNPIINLVEKENFDDGTERYVSTTKMPLKDKEGNIVGTFGISRNVTDSKNREYELSLLNNLINDISNNIHSFFFGFKADGSIEHFTGKIASHIKPKDKSSAFTLFKPLKGLLEKNEDQYQFDYSYTENGLQWNFDVLILKSPGTENGYIGFGLEKDLINYDAKIKSAITSLLKAKDNLDNLRNG